MTTATYTDPKCDNCRTQHKVTDWNLYGAGYRDGAAGVYAPRSLVAASHGYDAGHCDGKLDAKTNPILQMTQAELEEHDRLSEIAKSGRAPCIGCCRAITQPTSTCLLYTSPSPRD